MLTDFAVFANLVNIVFLSGFYATSPTLSVLQPVFCFKQGKTAIPVGFLTGIAVFHAVFVKVDFICMPDTFFRMPEDFF